MVALCPVVRPSVSVKSHSSSPLRNLLVILDSCPFTGIHHLAISGEVPHLKRSTTGMATNHDCYAILIPESTRQLFKRTVIADIIIESNRHNWHELPNMWFQLECGGLIRHRASSTNDMETIFILHPKPVGSCKLKYIGISGVQYVLKTLFSSLAWLSYVPEATSQYGKLPLLTRLYITQTPFILISNDLGC